MERKRREESRGASGIGGCFSSPFLARFCGLATHSVNYYNCKTLHMELPSAATRTLAEVNCRCKFDNSLVNVNLL